ncbi:MAG: hypothetical protein R2745_06515 [Vicinamibacterales bacterium]
MIRQRAGGLSWIVAAAVLAAPASSVAQVPPSGSGEVLLERTLAIVGGAVITQSDVDLARALDLAPPATGPSEPWLDRLIDRMLMLHEVARFAPPEPSPEAVEAALAPVRARGGAALGELLKAAGASPARLEAWVRDDLRIAAYLNQRFASPGAPGEADVDAYLDAHAADLAGQPDDAARRAAARARLAEERRRDLITDWLADVRRRTTVLRFAPAAAF